MGGGGITTKPHLGDAYDLGGYEMFGVKREHEEYKRDNPSQASYRDGTQFSRGPCTFNILSRRSQLILEQIFSFFSFSFGGR